jgi:hypothetical protein
MGATTGFVICVWLGEANIYANPILLPQFTNREDLLLQMSVFDDDLNQAVNLSGITGSGTFSSWTVTDGAIATTSSTAITIPQFPVGNQLSSLALTVGTSLGILAGDPILIADSGTGLNTMSGYVLSYTSSNGALVVQIGVALQFEIRRPLNSGPLSYGYGYSSFPAIGRYDDDIPEITASLGNGILITDIGYLQILIPETQFKQLAPGTRRASLSMTDSVNTRQLFLAQLPILSGGLTN